MGLFDDDNEKKGATPPEDEISQFFGGLFGGNQSQGSNPLEGMFGGRSQSGQNPLEGMFGGGGNPLNNMFGSGSDTGQGGLGGLLGQIFGGGGAGQASGGGMGGLGGLGGGALGAILMWVLQSQGGFAGIMEKLQRAGMGAQQQSWIGDGHNEMTSPSQLSNAFSERDLDELTRLTGSDREESLSMLAKFMPEFVDKATQLKDVDSDNAASQQDVGRMIDDILQSRKV